MDMNTKLILRGIALIIQILIWQSPYLKPTEESNDLVMRESSDIIFRIKESIKYG